MLTEREIDTINQLKNEIKKRLNETHENSVLFFFYTLPRIPLLKDQMGLEKILDLVKRKSSEKISWRPIIGQRRGPICASDPEPQLRAPSQVGVEIHVDDVSKIDEYFDLILKNSNIENSTEIEIISLHINKHEDASRITVIINEEYSDKKVQPLVKKGRWKKLLEVAEDGSAEADNAMQAKSIVDYFNTNEGCMIYSKYPKYKLTKILKLDDDQIFKNIKIEIISQKTLNLRQNKTT